jgi:hypothetical protein
MNDETWYRMRIAINKVLGSRSKAFPADELVVAACFSLFLSNNNG